MIGSTQDGIVEQMGNFIGSRKRVYHLNYEQALPRVKLQSNNTQLHT